MNAEFFDAIADIEREKGIPSSYMLERIGLALIAAYRKGTGESEAENVFVVPDTVKKTIRMYVRKTIVPTDEDVYDPEIEISLDEALTFDPSAKASEFVDIDIDTRQFGRIAAQTAKQVIIQGIREAERGMVLQEYSSKEHEIITGTVMRTDSRNGNVYINIGAGKDGHGDAALLPGEQMPGETYNDGDHVKVYVVEVRSGTRGPQIVISRTHPGLVKRLFELEVPEIHSGVVEIKSISREAGSRTKLAVYASDGDVDPIGACVGPRGSRVEKIVDELRGEKIDIIKYSDDPAEYIAAALAPSDVTAVTVLEDGKSCRVIVPDDQLSLAIGREGQNARLAARLTGFKIDIKPLSQA